MASPRLPFPTAACTPCSSLHPLSSLHLLQQPAPPAAACTSCSSATALCQPLTPCSGPEPWGIMVSKGHSLARHLRQTVHVVR